MQFIMSLQLYGRYRIIFLSQDTYGLRVINNEVVKIIKCNTITVKRWFKRWKETKDLNDRSRKGRSCVTTAAADQLIVDLV